MYSYVYVCMYVCMYLYILYSHLLDGVVSQLDESFALGSDHLGVEREVVFAKGLHKQGKINHEVNLREQERLTRQQLGGCTVVGGMAERGDYSSNPSVLLGSV